MGEERNDNMENSNRKNNAIAVILIVIIAIGIIFVFLLKQINSGEISTGIKRSEYRMTGNSLQKFDLYFLQLENQKKNKVYSPLSIKYALEMLAEGANGTTKEQITNIIGEYKANKYVNSKNMSFANVMFINESSKDSINNEYSNILSNKYGAEVILDPFKTPDNINTWVKNKTLNLIENAFDNVSSDTIFMLMNALGIDMEWQENFIKYPGTREYIRYSHEKFSWEFMPSVIPNDFDNTQKVSGMKINASLNNYDIISVLGEEKIREEVSNEYRKYLNENIAESSLYIVEDLLNNDTSEENINKVVNEYVDKYIKEIGENYKRIDKSTDFSIYVDDDVKAFAKDLKEYDGTTLQYIGIMPTNTDLESYINLDNVNKVVNNLKEIKHENFKEGVVTKIDGFIPKFKFDYELNLQEDLEKLGVTDVFDSNKADLSGITSLKNVTINVGHKANIEFTQDGIKASAVTEIGAGGAGEPFDYLYDVPVEEIDLTFDKPYMFLIRNKETGEVWFTGTVYNPLSWEIDKVNVKGGKF